MSAIPTKAYCNWPEVHRALDAAPVLTAAKLCTMDWAVLLVIARHINKEDNTSFLSYTTIAAEAVMSYRSAIRAVSRLTDAKLVAIVGAHHSGANRYRLTLEQCQRVTPVAESGVSESHPPVSESQGGSVRESGVPVSESQGGSVRESHEVKNSEEVEVKKEEKKEVEKETASVERVAPDRVGSQETTKTTAQAKAVPAQPNTVRFNGPAAPPRPPRPAAASPAPAPDPNSPERELTARYFHLLGSPRRLATKLAIEWPDIFRRLLADHQYDDLLAVMEWALANDFWPEHIHRANDPADYFVSKLDTLLDQQDRDQRAKKNTAKKAPQAAADAELDALLAGIMR